MTNADVSNLMRVANERGIDIDEHDARQFLGAKELLAQNPQHPLAKQVINDFLAFMDTGKRPKSVAAFLIPFCATDEELAHVG